MKIVTSLDSMNAVEAMVNMLEAREWAEHSGVCDVTRRLEACVTTLHNEISQRDEQIFGLNNAAIKEEETNAQAITFLTETRDGLGELLNDYRDEIWRLRDGINAFLNICTPENNDHILCELRDLATSKIDVCPPLKNHVLGETRFTSVWDALCDNADEREDMKERSRLMRIIRNTSISRWGKKDYEWLATNVGFSQTIWCAIREGHIDELEQDVLVQIADMLNINIIPGQCEPAIVDGSTDEDYLAKMAQMFARSIVTMARARNTKGMAERYAIPRYCEEFKITKVEWHILEAMSRQTFVTDSLPIPRLIQIAKDGDVTLPVVE